MTWGAQNVTVRFGRTVALDDVSLEVAPGRIHAVVGGDGAGKSTLLRVLAGLGLDRSGSLRLPGQALIGYVPSSGGVFPDLTVDENMQFVAGVHRLDRRLGHWRERSAHLLERAGVARFGDRLAGQLSGGQRRKLAGAMAVLPEPQLLILDEVTTGVDPISRMELWRLIASTAAAGAAVVAATSYVDEGERAGWVQLLDAGRVLAAGAPDDVIASMPGWITEVARPESADRAWRRGRGWRQWHAGDAPAGTPRPSLEDAAIVHELLARRAEAVA
jgi:ABC-2 type transport system ATP-binding protein